MYKQLLPRGGVWVGAPAWVGASRVWDPPFSYNYALGGWVCIPGPPLYFSLWLGWVGPQSRTPPLFFVVAWVGGSAVPPPFNVAPKIKKKAEKAQKIGRVKKGKKRKAGPCASAAMVASPQGGAGEPLNPRTAPQPPPPRNVYKRGGGGGLGGGLNVGWVGASNPL